jgi:hypothetical protein
MRLLHQDIFSATFLYTFSSFLVIFKQFGVVCPVGLLLALCHGAVPLKSLLYSRALKKLVDVLLINLCRLIALGKVHLIKEAFFLACRELKLKSLYGTDGLH